MLCVGPLVPLEVKFKEAGVLVPLPEGENLTVNAQLPPAATLVQVFPVSANSAVLPVTVAPLIVSGPLPELVTVNVLSE
jgi:hypothetical protein